MKSYFYQISFILGLEKKKLPNYYAVTVNKKVVSKSEFNKIGLQNNDVIEIIVAVGGG